MLHKLLLWLCPNEFHYSKLLADTNVVQLIKTLKLNRVVLLLFGRWYYILKNIKSIREVVVFKIKML